MSHNKKNKSKLYEVENIYLEEEKKIEASKEWKKFAKASEDLHEAAFNSNLPFDPKFNAVHWAFAVSSLCREIVIGYCWMNAYAEYYKKEVEPGSQGAHVDFHVTYYADNCITRIDSCRDKLALMVWAFYCPFNPEKKDEILNYKQIIERLKYPIKFGTTIKNQDVFLSHLQSLNKGSDFSRIERYRHYKIHRIEPRIEIYGVSSHHGWSYMFPIINQKDISKWEEELKKEYPDKQFREHIKKGCYIKGTLFEKRRIVDSIWDYTEVQKHIKRCMRKLLNASGGCFQILLKRSPLRRKNLA